MHYNVYASAVDSGYTLWQDNVAGTSLAIDFDAAFGTNWWYVVGIDSNGDSSYPSNHLECTPVMPTPTYSYLQPDGVGQYFQPDGVSLYLQP